MKKLIALLLALSMMFALVACGNSDKPADDDNKPGFSADDVVVPPAGGEAGESIVVDKVSYGLRNSSWDLGPWKNNGSSGNTIFTQLWCGLMANPTFGTALENFYYDMAESYEISEDKMVATIKLRDYVHDSKGNPIKAEDVVFSYQTAPKVAGAYAKVGVGVTMMCDNG